jgi:competence protein ComEC
MYKDNNKINIESLIFSPLLGLILGIVAEYYSLFSLLFMIFIVLIACVIFVVLIRFLTLKILINIVLLWAFFIVGVFAFEYNNCKWKKIYNNLSGEKLDLVVRVIDKKVDLEGRIKEVLIAKIVKINKQKNIELGGFSVDIKLYLLNRTKLLVGDIVLFPNIFIKNNKLINISGNPSFIKYLNKERIVSVVFLYNPVYKLINRPYLCFKRWLWELRLNISYKIQKNFSLLTKNYFKLIFLGDKQGDSRDLRLIFNQWGLAHYLARAGLHIVLFILIWIFLLAFLPIHLVIKRILLLIICSILFILSWVSVPFARAFWVFLLMEIGHLLNRQVNFLYLLMLICCFMLICNPMQLFFLDFQLTFVLTFALAML